MSARALLKGVESVLRTALADPDGRACGVQPDGRPPPGAGQWYYAVHYAGRRGVGTIADHLDTAAQVTVTITAKMAYAPRDRRGDRLTLDAELLDRAEAVARAVHGNYLVLVKANVLTPGVGTSTNGFVEPLLFQGDTPVLEKGPDWVYGQESSHPPTVLAVEVRFGGARRIEVA